MGGLAARRGAAPVSAFVEGAVDGAALELLANHRALRVTGCWPEPQCEAMTARVLAARGSLTPAFNAEQFSLGRAFYTHLESAATRAYFAHAAESDATVEAVLPGFQHTLRGLLGALLGAEVRPRRGWCGPGVHVFDAGSKVARLGGVVHFDLEGLSAWQRAQRVPAVTLVVMLQTASRGGGLRLWPTRYDGRDEAGLTPDERAPGAAETLSYGVGDLVLIESRRLHQIEPFGGDRARVSATLHAAQIDRRTWESWF